MRILQQKNCENCGIVIFKKENRSQLLWDTVTKFCSAKCHDEFRKGKPSPSPETTFKKGHKTIIGYIRKGKENNMWKGGPLKKKCTICHKRFYVFKDRLNAKCCSIKCSKLHRQTEEFRMKLSKVQRARVPVELQKTKNFRNLLRRCSKYNIWREKIFKRDNFTCQLCGKRGGKLQADHKKSFIGIILKNKIDTYEQAITCKGLWNIRNGRTLCLSCHYATPTFGSKVHKTLTINKK